MMSAVRTIHGAQVRLHEPPPEGFRALEASERELLVHGLPRRPAADAPRAVHRRWEQSVVGLGRHLVPEFSVSRGVRHHRGARAPVYRNDPPFQNPNWSGSFVDAPSGKAFAWISGQWTIPNPFPFGAGDEFHMSSWIGLDAGSDIVQTGVHQIVHGSEGNVNGRDCYAWWEWVPGDEVRIDNFPVSPGDVVNYLICGDLPSDATIYVTNNNTRIWTSFTVTPPAGTISEGFSAEWVVETPTKDGELTAIPWYNETLWEGTWAGFSGGGGVVVPADGQVFQIVRDQKILSSGGQVCDTIYRISQPTS